MTEDERSLYKHNLCKKGVKKAFTVSPFVQRQWQYLCIMEKHNNMASKYLTEIRTVKEVLLQLSLEHRSPVLPRGYHPVPEPDFISVEMKNKPAINIDNIGQQASERKSQCSLHVYLKSETKNWNSFFLLLLAFEIQHWENPDENYSELCECKVQK